MSILELIKQRRIWAGVIGIVTFAIGLFHGSVNVDANTLADLLTQFGDALSGLIVAVLALWSFFKPKK